MFKIILNNIKIFQIINALYSGSKVFMWLSKKLTIFKKG